MKNFTLLAPKISCSRPLLLVTMRPMAVSAIALCLFFSLIGCKKILDSTLINITVVDKKTSKPVAGAKIDLNFHYETSVSGSIRTTYENFEGLTTNAMGQIKQVVVKDSEYAGYTAKAYKPGYLHNFFGGIKEGENNDLTIELTPRDGILNLSIKNETGNNDTIYVSIFSQLEKNDNGLYSAQILSKYPLVLPKGDSYTEQFGVTTPENIDIKWGTRRPTYQKPFEKKASVFVKDTSSYSIVF